MTPFLKQVADHYYRKGIEGRCFVFPNRRSIAFFRKYLSEAIAADPLARPLILPQMFTINDLFFKVSGACPLDRVRLLLELYECYAALNPKAESLDEFIFWGDVILGDFNDVDKYLVDPEQLFTNVADLKRIQDSFSYLTDTQRDAIERFVKHFQTELKDIKSSFLQIWNILLPLYKDFNERLSSKGWAYEGMVYRSLAQRLREEPAADVLHSVFPNEECFVFIGLNALNECEKTLLRKLRDASKAEFCWDYTGDMISNPQNRASLFMSENVLEFPQAAQWDAEGLPVPEINVLSVASSVGQAKRLPDILKSVQVPDECAVVLPDENLLVPVLNSIPENISDINVTMGLPMSGSLLYSMMSDVSAIQLHVTCRKDKWFFYHKQVWDLFSNDLFRKALDEESRRVVSDVKAKARYYIPLEELAVTPLLKAVFQVAVKDASSRDAGQIDAFAEYQKNVLRTIAPAVADDSKLVLELEYAKEYYRSINMLQKIGMEVLPLTYVRLLGQLLGSVAVPFRGEPLKGLQVMGPLEMRALDFRTLIIMSSNEGVFPRRSVSSSFIPPELRKGFGLPTYEYQDAVWAYYFYRMISRAEKVWMLVDSRTEGLKSGEESRYIKQLEYHFGVKLNRYVVKFDSMKTAQMSDIVKTPEDVEVIRQTELSATTLQNYLACPAKFYYGTVKRLQPEDEVVESVDYGTFGTVYHDTMRALYTSEEAMREDFFFDHKGENAARLNSVMRYVTKDYINSWINRKEDITRKVKSLIVNLLSVMEVSGRNLVVTDVIVSYVIRTLERDLETLERAGADSFEILGREIKVKREFGGLMFKGYIDRLDSCMPGQARVVDYKTGKVLKDDVEITDGNAAAIAENIFAPDVKDRPKIALQFYIYDMLLQDREEVKGRQLENCVYSVSKLFSDLQPPKSLPVNEIFYKEMSRHLQETIDEMTDLQVGFRRTEDLKVCSYCDFKTICGR